MILYGLYAGTSTGAIEPPSQPKPTCLSQQQQQQQLDPRYLHHLDLRPQGSLPIERAPCTWYPHLLRKPLISTPLPQKNRTLASCREKELRVFLIVRDPISKHRR